MTKVEEKKSLAPATNREHSKELIRAFTPIRFFLIIIGQMPFDIKKKKDNTYTFKLDTRSKTWFIFLFVFSIATMCYLVLTAGIFSFIFNKFFSQWINPTVTIPVKDVVTGEADVQLWERHYTRREMVPVLVIWSWMTISFVGSVHVILYGKFFVHYMNYFNRVTQMMDIDMTWGIKNYLWRTNVLTIGVAVSLLVGFVFAQLADFNAVGNTASVIINFILRMFHVEIENLGPGLRVASQIGGLAIMLLALVGSRANVIQFLFFSQLLKNGAKVWNQRFTVALEIDQSHFERKGYLIDSDTHQINRRLDLKHILKDHLILVQLFRMTESVFGFILLTYYGFEILAVVMEVYQLASLGGFLSSAPHNGTAITDDDDVTTHRSVFEADKNQEWEQFSTAVVCVVLMIQHVWFAISTTTDAAAAYEQAMEGFNILRQHGFMYCRNRSDRNFVLSMFSSFSKNTPMQLTAGGYFAINKTLLVAMAAAIVNWAVSIYQTKIDQWT